MKRMSTSSIATATKVVRPLCSSCRRSLSLSERYPVACQGNTRYGILSSQSLARIIRSSNRKKTFSSSGINDNKVHNENDTDKDDEKDFATLILLRHGQSVWNAIPTFTGWCDVALTDRGILQGQASGQLLKQRGYTHFDLVYTSTLKRAIQTCQFAVQAACSGPTALAGNDDAYVFNRPGNHLDSTSLPTIIRAWQLNERHYGALQGHRKDEPELLEKYGIEQLKLWRRAMHAVPPPMDEKHKYYQPPPAPLTESLKDCQDRVLKYYKDTILPSIQRHQKTSAINRMDSDRGGVRVLLVAHSNTLRALISYLDDVPSNKVPRIHVPNSVPCMYKIDPMTGKAGKETYTVGINKSQYYKSHGEWLFSAENYKRLKTKIGSHSDSFVHSIFDAWDTNGDRLLSKQEIMDGLRELMGDHPDDVTTSGIAGKIMEVIDIDGSDSIDLDEFNAHAITAFEKFIPDLVD